MMKNIENPNIEDSIIENSNTVNSTDNSESRDGKKPSNNLIHIYISI